MFELAQQIATVDVEGLSAVVIFTVLFFATFVSEDAACVAAGSLAARGDITFGLALASCFSGIVIGDILLFWTGRLFGRSLLASRLGRRFVSSDSLDRGAAWLEKRGASAIFLSRFVTGLRLPTYLAAGFVRTDFRKFLAYFILAAAVWTPLVIASVTYSGTLVNGTTAVLAIGSFIALRIVMKLTNWRSRRLLVGRIRRILRWEFWPLGAFYLPVVVYVLSLAFRYRSFTVFTCANAAIPDGGFVGESKDDIYALISSEPENRTFLLPHVLISKTLSPSQRIDAATQFMTANELDFPVVLKPDVGERGKGVRIIRSRTDLDLELERADHDLIIQQFYDGEEVSIFYYRDPGRAHGSILSITEKIFPFVIGDGKSTIEELILSDDRAVCLAEKYFDENRIRLNDVPRPNERIRIIAIGTHSRGAIFVDGGHLRTQRLEDAIDAICSRTPGFNFGRFDIRFSSVDSFQTGKDFKIIELNGVTSESTNIYDPRYSLFDAYRILFKQWRLAFEIGAKNKSRGVRQSSLEDLFYAVLRAKLTQFA